MGVELAAAGHELVTVTCRCGSMLVRVLLAKAGWCTTCRSMRELGAHVVVRPPVVIDQQVDDVGLLIMPKVPDGFARFTCGVHTTVAPVEFDGRVCGCGCTRSLRVMTTEEWGRAYRRQRRFEQIGIDFAAKVRELDLQEGAA